MNITNVRIRTYEAAENNKRLGNVQVILGNGLVLYGISLLKGKNDAMWLSMPARRLASNNNEDAAPRYVDYFYPVSQEARMALTDAVVAHYEKLLEDANAEFVPVGTDEALEVESVRLTYPRNESNLLAFASVTLNCGIRLAQIRLVKRAESDDMVVMMPTRTRNEQNLEVFHPINQEFRSKLVDAIIAKYNEEKAAKAE